MFEFWAPLIAPIVIIIIQLVYFIFSMGKYTEKLKNCESEISNLAQKQENQGKTISDLEARIHVLMNTPPVPQQQPPMIIVVK